jgi:hypothetical protein
MKFSAEITGVPEVMLALRNLAETVPDKARKTMHRNADKIVELARLQAPVDKHNLEDSIHKEIGYDDARRLQIDIIAGGEVNGVNVEDYVALIHENYSSMKPGPGTVAKMTSNPGVLIGEKFLTRAYDKYEAKLNADMIQDVLKDVKL